MATNKVLADQQLQAATPNLEEQIKNTVASRDANKVSKTQMRNLNQMKVDFLAQLKDEVVELDKDAKNTTIGEKAREAIQAAAKARQGDYDSVLDSLGTWTTGLSSPAKVSTPVKTSPVAANSTATPSDAAQNATPAPKVTIGVKAKDPASAMTAGSQGQKTAATTVTTTTDTPSNTVTVTTDLGGVSAKPPTDSNASTTILLDVSPASVGAGAAATSVTLEGANFDDKTSFYFDDRRVSATVKTSDTVHASVTLSDIELANAGYHCFGLQASLPDPESHECATLSAPSKPQPSPIPFFVTNPTPTLAASDPSGLATSPSRPISLTPTGTKIKKGAQVVWNGEVICDKIFRAKLVRQFESYNADITCEVHVIDETAVQVDLGIDTSAYLKLRKSRANLITIRNPGPGGGESQPVLVSTTRPEPQVSSGSLSTKVFVGTDLSGASSLPTQQKVFVAGDLQHPVPSPFHRPYPIACQDDSFHQFRTPEECEIRNLPLLRSYIRSLDPLNRRLWLWTTARVTALPTQSGTGGLGLANVQTSSDLINQLEGADLNKVVQGFETLSGVEVAVLKPRSGIPMSFSGGNTRMSVSLAFGGGFITPFSQPNSVQQQYVATQDLINRFTGQPNNGTGNTFLGGGTTTCAKLAPAPMSTQQCFDAILFVPMDSPRFFKQYYAGPRFKIWYFRPAGAENSSSCVDGARFAPNDVCKTYPAVMDAAVGQNAAITAGHQKGLVVKLEGSFPIFLSGAVYVYAAGFLHVTGSSPSIPTLLCNPTAGASKALVPCPLQQPAVFSPVSSPLGLADPGLFRLADPGADRDFFHVGIGVDLLQLLQKKISGTQSTTSSSAKPAPSSATPSPTSGTGSKGGSTASGSTSTNP